MIIFLAEGRLGNQIFQYVFLKTIQKNDEKIIVSGFEDLKEVFEIDDIVFLNKKNRWIRAFLFRVCKPIFYFLADKNIISSISVNHEKVLEKYRRESTTFSKQKGFLSFIIFVKLGFFQSEKFFDADVVKQLKIKDKFLKEADLFLGKLDVHKHKVFIHIRRGDYDSIYSVYGKSAMLPISYFKKQIEWFTKNKENAFFVFLSDDTEFIKKEFNYVQDKIVSTNNTFGADIAIMTQCQSAILSPSSFGWWGAYMMKERYVVFTPRYWTGFNSRIEKNTNANLSFATEIEVSI